ncbi:MAG TPA: GNAT family N-acetyltransferase [Gaiellaceae bacterium]|nr:GNAT family N-acetyltransferase [Gaiellaceae bacterium]
MAIRVRTVRNDEELALALGGIGHYFGWVPTAEEVEPFKAYLPLDRMHVALDDKLVIGGAGVYPFELTVPGGPLRCAGVTIVGVHPTHRRQGVLRRMMTTQLKDIREREEPFAALWASEDTIYGRYGYGAASRCAEIRLPRVSAELRPGTPPREGEVRLVDHDEAMKAFPRIYERLRRTTTGFVLRTQDWWRLRNLDDRAEWRRGGAGPLNRALLEFDGRPAGYALYRIAQHPTDFKRTLRVIEAQGLDARATREIWRFLLGIDWMEDLAANLLPLDHPIWQLVARPRLLGMKVWDGLWVRPVDVGAMLAGRSYADGRTTIEVVSDPLFDDNVGTWTIADGRVRRTSRRPDVRLDVQALGSAFLSGFTFAQLARGGRVEEAARGGIARADTLFQKDTQPWCPEIF